MNARSKIVFFSCILMICLCFSGCSGNLQHLLEVVPGDIVLGGKEMPSSVEHLSLKDVAESLGNVSLQNQPENITDILPGAPAEGERLFLMEDAGEYAFNCLSRTEQIWYRDIERILGSFGVDCKLSDDGLENGLTEKNIDKIFQCVLYDHPELFFVEGYSYTLYSMAGKLMSVAFSGTYTTDKDTALAQKEEIELAVDELLAGVPADASQYDKVRYVYEQIILNTDYDLNVPDNQNIYSVFIHHCSVCQGYAKATQYLLNRLGVNCTLVLGTVDSGDGHAWNLVQIDGNYYYLDTTWGDASYRLADGMQGTVDMWAVNYDYLNVTTEEILRTHRIESEIPMPECVSGEANYYVRQGMLFDAYDKERLEKLFGEMKQGNRSNVTIKCADSLVYEEIRSALVDRQEIFQFLDDLEQTVTFSQNETQLSMTFWVTNE